MTEPGRRAYRWFLFTEVATSLPPFLVVSLYLINTVELNPLELVLVGTVMELAVFVFEVPTGVVADLYGRKLSLVVSWIVQGLAIVLVGAVPEVWAALAGWALWRFGYTFSSGAYEAWITDEVGAEHVGPVFARGVQLSYAAALVGMPLFVGIAAATSLRSAVLMSGAVPLALGLLSVVFMPETAFRKAERREGEKRREQFVGTAARGARLVRSRPALLLLLVAAFFAGAYTEGFDRLWEAHFIRDVGLPAFAGLSSLWWFALLGAAAMLAGLFSSTVLVRWIGRIPPARMALVLLGATVAQMLTVVAFGLAAGFALAAATFVAARLARGIFYPLQMTWLNQSIDDSSVRATVISINGQADAVGQVAGGPGVGAIGTVFSIRAALVATGLVLLPAIALFGRAARHGGKEPELEDAEPAVT